MMTTGPMLWEAALYNNGGFPYKDAHFGESYGADGTAQRLNNYPAPSAELTRTKGVLPHLDPLGRWEVSQPGNILRVFERGGGERSEIGIPNPDEDPGRPDEKLSDRGLGTELRTDPVFLGLQKTRLLDPILSLPGTNDHPGDYRNSGCTACHVIYANDRSPVHSGPYAQVRQPGAQRADRSHHSAERIRPSDQARVHALHSHQPVHRLPHPSRHQHGGVVSWATSGGTTKPTASTCIRRSSTIHRMKSASKRGRRIRRARRRAGCGRIFRSWKKPARPEFNQQLKHTQFADFHGHGWVFRAVYKRDRKGNLLDPESHVVPPDDKDKFQKAVQLRDIHLEKGMHCTDCHFAQDNHGDGNLYGETRNAVEIDCVDCHGAISHKATLRTSAAAAPVGGTDLSLLRTPWGQRRFYWQEGKLYQRSMVDKDRAPWDVVQVVDTITPGNPHYNEKSRLAKTILKDGTTWGSVPGDESEACAFQRTHDVLRVPHVLDHQLLRLPSADVGQSQDADAAQRRADHAQLHRLQL